MGRMLISPPPSAAQRQSTSRSCSGKWPLRAMPCANLVMIKSGSAEGDRKVIKSNQSNVGHKTKRPRLMIESRDVCRSALPQVLLEDNCNSLQHEGK